jgi:hypothetical protein
MIDLSPTGFLGAVVGTVVAGFLYGPLVVLVGRGFKSRQPAETAEERATLEQEMSALRRAVLAADIIVFAGIGYWLGMTIGG